MYARFGQELYPHETLAAAALLAQASRQDERPSSAALAGRVALLLPEGSPAHRQRVAVLKRLLQRVAAGAQRAAKNILLVKRRGKIPNPARRTGRRAFAHLLAYLPDTQARQDLVYYGAARADALIGAIARDVLYPYFIEDRIPPPFERRRVPCRQCGPAASPRTHPDDRRGVRLCAAGVAVRQRAHRDPGPTRTASGGHSAVRADSGRAGARGRVHARAARP